MRVWLCVAVVAAGCGKKGKPSPDCARYAERMAELSTEGLTGEDRASRARTVSDGAALSCRSGRVDAKEIECTLAARTSDDLWRCAGLAVEPTTVAVDAAPAARIARERFSAAVPPGWEETPGFEGRPDEIRMQNTDEVVATAASYGLADNPMAEQIDDATCAERGRVFAGETGATFDSTAVVTAAGRSGCQFRVHDDRFRIVRTSIPVATDEELYVVCMHSLGHPEPAECTGALLEGRVVREPSTFGSSGVKPGWRRSERLRGGFSFLACWTLEGALPVPRFFWLLCPLRLGIDNRSA